METMKVVIIIIKHLKILIDPIIKQINVLLKLYLIMLKSKSVLISFEFRIVRSKNSN